jgi:hypothetical protein
LAQKDKVVEEALHVLRLPVALTFDLFPKVSEHPAHAHKVPLKGIEGFHDVSGAASGLDVGVAAASNTAAGSGHRGLLQR